MKVFGWVFLIIGVLCVLSALNMDVSVSSGYGRVNNIGLMSLRQNYITIGGFISLFGILMLIFGREKNEEAEGEIKCPLGAELIKKDAIKCKHCGSVINNTNNVIESDISHVPDEVDNPQRGIEPDKVMIAVGVAVVIIIVVSYFYYN